MSKLLMGCACTGTVLGGMYLHGDLSGGQIYNVPIHDAYLRAQNAEINSLVGAGLLDSRGCDIERSEDDSVAWACGRNGTTVGRLVATLKDLGDGRTRVWVSFKPTDASGEDVERSRTFMKKVGQTVMGETVGAAIDQRPVDRGMVTGALQAYLMTNMQDVFKDVSSQMEEASKDMGRHSSSGNADLREAQRDAGRPTVEVGRGSSYDSRYR